MNEGQLADRELIRLNRQSLLRSFLSVKVETRHLYMLSCW